MVLWIRTFSFLRSFVPFRSFAIYRTCAKYWHPWPFLDTVHAPRTGMVSLTLQAAPVHCVGRMQHSQWLQACAEEHAPVQIKAEENLLLAHRGAPMRTTQPATPVTTNLVTHRFKPHRAGRRPGTTHSIHTSVATFWQYQRLPLGSAPSAVGGGEAESALGPDHESVTE